MTLEDEAFDEIARRQGMWGGGFPAKRQMAADKLQDGKCEYCVDGCIACDARAQPAQDGKCGLCGEYQPFTGVCGGGKENPIALCFTPPAAQPTQESEILTIVYQSGYHDGKQAARARCIELVLAGSSMPMQTKTLESLQRDRKRIAKLIAEDGNP